MKPYEKVRKKWIFKCALSQILDNIKLPILKIIELLKKIEYKKHLKFNAPFIIKNKIGVKIKDNGKEKIKIYESYEDAMNTFCPNNLIYHYKTEKKDYSHAHNFEGVIRALYYFPETFEIPNEVKDEYSNQQLNYLKTLKNELLESNLKDIYEKNAEIYEEHQKRNIQKEFYSARFFNEYSEVKKEIKKLKIKLGIMIILFFLFVSVFFIDIYHLSKNQNPLFMIKIKTIEEKYKIYYGIGYKAITKSDNIYIGTIFMKENISKYENTNIKIIDITKICEQKAEKIFTDETYEYYLPCKKSPNITIIKNNQKYKLKDALENKIVKIDEVRSKINIIKKIKDKKS